MSYTPKNVPTDQAKLPDFLRSEFQRLALFLSTGSVIVRLAESNEVPDKPRLGDIRLADGSDWNPIGDGIGPVWYDGTQWLPFGNTAYDVGCYIAGTTSASEVVMRFVAVRDFVVPAGMAGSEGNATVAATAQAIFSAKKNGTEFGTFTWAAAATDATIAAASDTSFTAGDVLSVVAPGTPDATLAGISITFKGART